MKRILNSFCVVLIAFVVGCEKPTAHSTGPAEPLPADLIVTTAPAEALDVVVARQAAKDGQPIVIKGFIGGQEEPLAENRAIMTLADLGLKTCDKVPGDTCTTPWDACCEPREIIAASSVSVQVLKPDGTPYRAGLNGISGIAPHKQVIISGIARPMNGTNALVIDADHIFVVP